jgi:HTH-type transcriptional regulator / antitoxin HigA
MIAVSRLEKLFAECGVIVVLLPEVRGTRLSGAARWLGRDRALIQLSLRHRSDDQFWFTVFHECGHLVESAGRRDFVDAPPDIGAADASGEELVADQFARDALIPPESYASFVTQADFSAQAARTFASEIGISPGIVAGRLQREGRIGPDKLTFLKQRYTWPTDTGSRTRG